MTLRHYGARSVVVVIYYRRMDQFAHHVARPLRCRERDVVPAISQVLLAPFSWFDASKPAEFRRRVNPWHSVIYPGPDMDQICSRVDSQLPRHAYTQPKRSRHHESRYETEGETDRTKLCLHRRYPTIVIEFFCTARFLLTVENWRNLVISRIWKCNLADETFSESVILSETRFPLFPKKGRELTESWLTGTT